MYYNVLTARVLFITKPGLDMFSVRQAHTKSFSIFGEHNCKTLYGTYIYLILYVVNYHCLCYSFVAPL